MKSDDRMLWIRGLDENDVSDMFGTIDAEVGSESRITGLIDYHNGAILFGPTTLSPDNVGLYKYLLRVRLASRSSGVSRGKRNGYLFSGGEISELIALSSLCLQARFYLLSTTLGHLTSKSIPAKAEFAPLRNAFGPNSSSTVAKK